MAQKAGKESLESLINTLKEIRFSIEDSNQNIKDALNLLNSIEKSIGIKKKSILKRVWESLKNK